MKARQVKKWIALLFACAYGLFLFGPKAHLDEFAPGIWENFSKIMIVVSVCLAVSAAVVFLMAIAVVSSGKEKPRDGEDWADKKRYFGIPLSFTRYSLVGNKLMIESGIFNKKVDQIMLYRIVDFTLVESFAERIFGVGTVHICSADHTKPELNIAHIKYPQEVKDMLSDRVEEIRAEKGISPQEFILPTPEM